jgi:hypothetical protein
MIEKINAFSDVHLHGRKDIAPIGSIIGRNAIENFRQSLWSLQLGISGD